MISLQEFREDYINEINLDAIDNSEHQTDAFIDDMLEYRDGLVAPVKL